MALWPTTLRIGDPELKLLVTSPEGDDLIKARLPRQPRHPRALLTLLEGVALWSGEPLYAVISAGPHRDHWLVSEMRAPAHRDRTKRRMPITQNGAWRSQISADADRTKRRMAITFPVTFSWGL